MVNRAPRVPEPIARTRYTYAILDVSCECYQEIRAALVKAGQEYEYKIEGDEAGEVIDMNGLALSELEPPPVEVKTLPQYSDPTPGTPTELKISCSCSGPDVGLEPANALVAVGVVTQDKGSPTVELLCHYCGAAIMILRHATKPDEFFRKSGHEPETGGR